MTPLAPVVHWLVGGVNGELPMLIDGNVARATIGPFGPDTLDTGFADVVFLYVTDSDAAGVVQQFDAPMMLVLRLSSLIPAELSTQLLRTMIGKLVHARTDEAVRHVDGRRADLCARGVRLRASHEDRPTVETAVAAPDRPRPVWSVSQTSVVMSIFRRW